MTYKAVPYNWGDSSQHRHLMAEAINELRQGRMNVTGEVTLEVSATQTTLEDARINADCVCILQPQTATAAAALASVYIPEHGNGSLTIEHDSTADTDRTFRYALIG